MTPQVQRAIAVSLVACAMQLPAQSPPAMSHSGRPGGGVPADSGTAGTAWWERLSVSVRYGQLRPAGNSELYSLVDRALTPGASALRPALIGGELHLRLRPRWSALIGLEGGDKVVASRSQAQPTIGSDVVRQHTRLNLRSMSYAGIEWDGWRWRTRGASNHDRLTVSLGAGAGVVRYGVRQWGDFVDATRGIAYSDDFRSSGHGALGFASLTVDAPIRSWVSLRGQVRQQRASAPMSGDYDSFDRLDLGGTRFGLGLRLRYRGSETIR